MFIYNVTVHVTHDIHDAWLTWQKEIHIPAIMQTGCFEKFQFVQLLETDEAEGVTYAVQFYAESKSLYNRYIEKFAPSLRESTLNKWGDKIIAFRSLMQVVD
ncbi:MAG: hypothetical protein JWN76_2502 [Chitinophagaceae bacterium]|nr:hypothetical protein [Chitinophagaceae bacterium]